MSDSENIRIDTVAEEMATYVRSLPRYSRHPTLKGVPLTRFFFGSDDGDGCDSSGHSHFTIYVNQANGTFFRSGMV
ncbi:hypothetical protein [Algoriphagus boritolerans]|uniref:hypothetical protein n=1 Tax=Algoriphagus boritolerans TaxID=308111 RepID=UPI000AF8B226